MGPGTPLGEGAYRVRWHGTGSQGQTTELGFVEICHSDCRVQLAKKQIVSAGEDTVAEITFQVPRELRGVEFRMYVNNNSGINLSHVSITQQ